MVVILSLFQIERIYLFFGDTKIASILYLILVTTTMLVNYFAIAYDKEINNET